MIRDIVNNLAGRKKTIDKNLSIEEVITLLNGLNGNVRGSICCYLRVSGGMAGARWDKQYKLEDVGLEKIANTINRLSEKESKKREYSNSIKHQMYSGRLDERHYLKIIHGEIEECDGVVVDMYPDTKYLIDFFLKCPLFQKD